MLKFIVAAAPTKPPARDTTNFTAPPTSVAVLTEAEAPNAVKPNAAPTLVVGAVVCCDSICPFLIANAALVAGVVVPIPITSVNVVGYKFAPVKVQ